MQKHRASPIALALVAASCASSGAEFPTRPITLIVPFPPGGSTDVAGRIIADKMGAFLGQPVIVENVGGAGGSIGVGRLARATPDGYTIDIGQWDTHVGSIIYNLNYDLQTDFEPIGLVSNNPQLLVAKKALPADDLKALVAWMKQHPGDAKFVNQNAAAQVSGLLLQKLTDTKVLFIPYRGAGPAMTDLISGQVDLLVAQGAVTLPQIRAGAIKAIVNMSPQRSGAIPDIPTSDEAGVPGPLHVGMVRPVRAQGDAACRHRQAQRRDGGGAGRSESAHAVRRARARYRAARAADPVRPRRVPQGRDREVVADHQGRRHPRRVGETMAKAYFMVRSVVEEPLRQKFDHWYSTHHLPMALAEFKAEKCWRFWSAVDAAVHYAVYQFPDMARLDAAMKSQGFRAWSPISTRPGRRASPARAIC